MLYITSPESDWAFNFNIMKEKEITYTEAFEELKEIASQLEDENVAVDELAVKLKRATMLMKICKDKLSQTEEEVNKTITELS